MKIINKIKEKMSEFTNFLKKNVLRKKESWTTRLIWNKNMLEKAYF